MGNVFLATIIVSVPEFGVALIATAGGTPDIKTLYVAHLPINDGTTGASPQVTYTDGTSVICMHDSVDFMKAYILAPASYATADLTDTLAAKALYNANTYTEADSKVFVNLLEQVLADSDLGFSNYSHGADIDEIPGDYDIIDQQGNTGIHVGRYVSQLRGSPMAFIDASNITHAIRTVASKLEKHLPLSVDIEDKELFTHDIAINDKEAFGVTEASPEFINVAPSELWQSTEAQYAIPLYRLQKMEGAAVDGKEELIIGDPPDTDVYHYCTTEPPILAKCRQSLMGEFTDASARGILSIKSPAIAGIHQINYNASRSFTEQDDILQPYEYKGEDETSPKKVSEEDLISDAAINKLLDKLFTGDYLETLKAKFAEHGLKVSSTEASIAAKIEKDGKEGGQVDGPTTEQQYGLPSSIALTDPVTGKQVTYYATTSFISQEPDGSILICDGYGSEIRMSRGNIYIGPALDLFLRPGRDLSTMVPRHQSFNAQEHTTINSSRDIYVRAVGNLKMVGATGEDGGMVVLECATDMTSNLNGLMLKSGCGTALTGNDIYIGRNSGIGLAKTRVEEPMQPGSIIIDACSSGAITQRCAEYMADANSICLVASYNNAASAIRINDTSIGIYTKGVELPATVMMTGKKSSEQITVFREGAATKLTIDTDSAPMLIVEGAIWTGKGLTSNGSSRICGQLIANGVASTNSECAVVDKRYGDPFEKVKIKKLDATVGLGEFTTNLLFSAAQSVYQDYYISMNGFSFPESYNVPQNIKVPGMLWQVATEQSGKGKFWKEQELTRPDGVITMCYPGYNVWINATVSQRNYKTVKLNTGYITNVSEGAN